MLVFDSIAGKYVSWPEKHIDHLQTLKEMIEIWCMRETWWRELGSGVIHPGQ
jgi:hypothetical protein